MKHTAFALAAILALALPSALAAQERQQQDQAQQSEQQGQQSEKQGQRAQGQQAQLSADAHHVVDKKAVNAQGKELGNIKDVLIGQDGRVQALIVDVSGKNRAIPWNQVSMKADQLTINMSDQQLSQLPEYRGEGD